jgi:hypothetical protein
MVKRTLAAVPGEEPAAVADLGVPPKKIKRHSALFETTAADVEKSSRFHDKTGKKQLVGHEPGSVHESSGQHVGSSEPLPALKKTKKKRECVTSPCKSMSKDRKVEDVARRNKSKDAASANATVANVIRLKYGWDWFERLKAEFKELSIRTSENVRINGADKMKTHFPLAFDLGTPRFLGEYPNKKHFPLTVNIYAPQEPVPSSTGDLWLRCMDCDTDFAFPKDEQVVFSNLGFQAQPPKRCLYCRRAKKERNERIAAKDAKGKGKRGRHGKGKSKGNGGFSNGNKHNGTPNREMGRHGKGKSAGRGYPKSDPYDPS